MNTFGRRFRLTTYGESHGLAIGGVVDGCPAGLHFDDCLLAAEMQRRHAGNHATSRHESDNVTILSGLLDGTTLGTPIAFEIHNNDTHSDDYGDLDRLYRPGHADYTYAARYGLRDCRGGGRASGRETASRVVGGAIAKMLLREKGINIHSSIVEQSAPADNDSSGGIIECTIDGLPAGVGNPIFERVGARLAEAMMTIPSAIGFEMGAGFAAAKMKGSQFRDLWCGNGSFATQTNHCGGTQGGISNGMPVVCRTAFHPVVTIAQPTECIDPDGNLHTWNPHGRHDQCHIPRTAVVVESMAALAIADLIVDN